MASFTVGEAISAIGMGKYQYLLLVYAAVGSIGRAMELMLLSYIGPATNADLGLSLAEQNFIFIFTYVGMFIGSYIWGYGSDAYGRKISLLGLSLLTSITGLVSASARNFTTLLVLRTLAGIGTGGTQVYTTWFMEFVPVANRGTWMIFFFVTGALGTSIEALIAWCIVPKYSWRWLVGATSLPSVLALVFYRRIPQSPTFLSSQGDLNGALTILEQVARRNRKELPEGQLVHDRINESADTQVEHNDDADSDTPSAIRSNPVDIEDAPTLNDPLLGNRIDGDPKRKLAISIILSREWIRITVLIWLLYFGNSFSYRGLILLLSPSFSEAPILQYEVHKNPSYYFDTLIISCAGIVGIGLAYAALDRLGRRYTMVIMCCGGFFCLVPQIFVWDTTLTIILVFGARTFMSASFIAVQIYAEKVYPTHLRTTAVGIATTWGWTGGMVWPALGNQLGKGHQIRPMSLFGFKILMSGVSALLLPVETLARELEESDNLE